MKFIDLSLTIEPTPSEPVPVKIDYISHEKGADILGQPIGLDHKDFPEQMGLSLEYVQITSHTGTHLDAPLHYGPMSEGEAAKSIEQIPLDWCYGPGVLLDCSDLCDEPVSVEEIQAALNNIGYQLRSKDIVLIYTGAYKLWGTPEYFTNFRGISCEATAWLIQQGIKVIGVDSFGFDPPFDKMLANYQNNPNSKWLWPAHIYGRKREYCQIERLTNLLEIDQSYNFMVACFPIKIKDCGAGWTRVVAILEDNK